MLHFVNEIIDHVIHHSYHFICEKYLFLHIFFLKKIAFAENYVLAVKSRPYKLMKPSAFRLVLRTPHFQSDW